MQTIQSDNQNQDDIIANFIVITNCKDDEKALSYLQMSNFQLENAIQLYMEYENHPHVQENYKQNQLPRARSSEPKVQTRQVQQVQKTQEISEYEQLLTDKYILYKQTKQESGTLKNFLDTTLSSVTSFFHKQPNFGEEFQNHLQSKKIKIPIKFEMDSFQKNMQEASKNIVPLFVYVHEISNTNILKNMFNCKEFVAKVNHNYRCFGFIANTQSLQQLPQQVERTPAIQIYRINFVEECILMETIYLNEQTDFVELIKRIKQIKGEFNKLYITEEKVKKQVEQPKSISQSTYQQLRQEQEKQEEQKRQREIQQERDILRQSQEEAYRLAEIQAAEKQKQKQEQLRLQQLQLEEKQKQEEDRLMRKAQMLSNLPNEPEQDSVCFKFQFFDKFLTRHFAKTDPIQVLFDYVQCQDDEYFLNSAADIDLIQNFPRLSLKDKKNQTIQEIFEDSTGEQLIVEEIE